MNIDRTNFMLFKQKCKLADIIDDVRISSVSISRIYQTKFLGVVISGDLSWDHHTNFVCYTISYGIGIIYKASYELNTDSLTTPCYYFIYPYLSYCFEVWGCDNAEKLMSLHTKKK